MAEEEEDVPDCPPQSGPRDNFVVSGEYLNFEYQVGTFVNSDGVALCSVIAVAECDGAVLCAVPEAAWDRTKSRRALPPDFLRKGVRVMVAASIDEDRTAPEPQPSFRVWVGILKDVYEQQVTYEEEYPTHGFPVDERGLLKLPYARALISVARDHFEFQTADSGGLGGAVSPLQTAARLAALEEELQRLRAAAPRPGSDPRLGQAPPAPASRPKAPPAEVPAGLDPALARQALQSGLSPDALGELATLVRGGEVGRARNQAAVRAARPVLVDSEEEDSAEELLAASGSHSPVELAVIQLSKIVSSMSKEKKVQRDKTIDGILDRAESGSGSRDPLHSSKSKAAALRTLRRLLTSNPELIYQCIEANMEQDWSNQAAMPGASASTITARGWLEHRSKLQNYQGPVRGAWLVAGIWDALRRQNVSEARARCALAVAAWDQNAIDRGGWLVSSELCLEEPPPFSSFAAHRPIEPWETPCTKLVDERWLEIILAKLKDLSDYQDRRQKLMTGNRRSEDATNDKETKETTKDPKPKKPKGKGKQKGEEAEKPQAAQ
eukprot:Skav223761  [mRNA]  locus=scaffold521:339:1994:+ [translate_table: standard]